MSDNTLRVEFETTLEEIVEGHMRFTKRTRAYRRNRALAQICCGGGFAVGTATLTLLRSPGSTSKGLVLLGAGVGLGVLVGYLYGPLYEWRVRRNVRRFVAEMYHDAPAVRCEIEIGDDGVRTWQSGTEIAFEWQRSTGVEDNSDTIDLWFGTGFVSVPNRGFRSVGDRLGFLERVRRLAAGAEPATENP